MTGKNQYPSENQDVITDERFTELTGGVEKGQLYPFMVDMRDYGSAGLRIGDSTIVLRPKNLENGALFPQLDIEGDGVMTTLVGFGGDKTSISVMPLSEDMKGLGSIRGELKEREGKQVQDETDFKIIPESHWRAIKIARDAIAEQNLTAATSGHAKKQGGFIRRLLTGGQGQSPYKN